MQKTFGRRNTNADFKNTYNRPAHTRRPADRENGSGRSEPHFATFGEDQVNEEREGGKLLSFFWACVTGFTFSVLAMSLFFTGSNAPSFFGGTLFLNIAGSFAMLTMAPFLLIPARILADIMRFIGVPRGYSDIMIGLMIGSVMPFVDNMSHAQFRWSSMSFVIGGAIGGFVYWRSRGYPGLKRKSSQNAETLFKWFKRLKPWEMG